MFNYLTLPDHSDTCVVAAESFEGLVFVILGIKERIAVLGFRESEGESPRM